MTHIAAADCERCRPGLVAQPANTVSSLGYVVAGAAVLRAERRCPSGRPSERALGWATAAAGLGSAAYHGPGTAAGRYLHDAALLAMLGLVALTDVEVSTATTAPVPAILAIPAVSAMAARPATSPVAQVAVGAAAMVGEVLRMVAADPGSGRRRTRAVEVVLAGAGAITHVLGRSGGPWCRPDRWIQPDGVWHLATGAVWLRHRDLDGPISDDR